jgi:O-antigen/teichoic acid export membrane protein
MSGTGGTTAPAPARRSFLYEVVRLLASNMGSTAMLVLVGIATARIWGDEGRGMIAAAMSVCGIVIPVLDLGVNKALPYMVGRREDSRDRVLRAAFTLWALTSTLGVLVALVYFLTPLQKPLPWYFLALAAYMIPQRLFEAYAKGYALGVERIGFLSRLIWVRDPLTLALVLGLGLAIGLGRPETAWLQIASFAVACTAATVMGLRMMSSFGRVRPIAERRLLGMILRRMVVFGLGPMLMIIPPRVDVFLVSLAGYRVPFGLIANLTVGTATAMLILQMSNTVGNVLMSRSVNTLDHLGQARKTARLVRIGMLGSVPGGIAMALLAPYVVPLVYGPGFAQAGPVIQLLSPGVVMYFMAWTYAVDLIAKGRPWLVTAVMLPTQIVATAVKAWWAIPAFGVFGAAATTSASHLVAAVGMLAVFKHASGLTFREILRPHRDDLKFGGAFSTERILARYRSLRRRGGRPPGADDATEG